ncbi:MAG: spore coat protein CotJB [Clostridia bacterium]|nr:spore coat protein CotJB [Clostridia bacterium]
MIDRNTVPNNGTRESNCKMLKRKLQAVDFAIVETTLYLDVYPDCKKALEYHKRLLKERKMLAEAVRASCGPTTAWEEQTDGWQWVKGPWPWEPDAN